MQDMVRINSGNLVHTNKLNIKKKGIATSTTHFNDCLQVRWSFILTKQKAESSVKSLS